MDQKDLLLIKAHSALMSTKAVLDKILRDDDDVILSARVIGDTGEDETMSTQTETPIEKLRRETFRKISELAYRKSPEDVEKWFDDQTWFGFPAVIMRRIEEFFVNPRHVPLPDRKRIDLLSDEAIERIETFDEIVSLLAALRKVDRTHDIPYGLKVSRERYDMMLRKQETPIETMRRHAFTSLASLTGRPKEKIAKLYDAIDWRNPVRWDEGTRTGRYAVVYDFLFGDLPQPAYYRNEPKNAEERERRQAYSDHVWAEHHRAHALVHPVTKTFENLRAEIGRWRGAQSLKDARKTDLQKQIMKAQAEYERLTAA